jgi:capsular polysaccharide transport system ATP-binding protein
MIRLKDVTKQYKTRSGIKTVLENINLEVFPAERVGILGVNGSGKSTIISLIGGIEQPTSGTIDRSMTASWPIGLAGGLQRTLSGIDNMKLICRIYNQNIEHSRNFLEDFTGLGDYLYEPVATYSSGMRSRLGLGISLLIDFDCYLIDEALSVGDKNLQEKYKALIDKRKNKATILVTHSESQIKKNCDTVYVLHEAKLHRFSQNIIAIEYYNYIRQLNKK